MKEGIGLKRLPVLLLTLIWILAGCGAGEPTALTINRSFCCPVAVEQGGHHLEAELTVTPEQCAAVFSLPDGMKGMTMTCRNNDVTVMFGENKSETPLPDARQCFLFWLSRALAQTNAAVIRRENAFALHGAVDENRYLLTIDRATLQPLYFEMDALDLTVRFQNGQ